MVEFVNFREAFLKGAISITPYAAGGRELMNVQNPIYVPQGHIGVSLDGRPFVTDWLSDCTATIIKNTRNGRCAFAHLDGQTDFDTLRGEMKPLRRGPKIAIMYHDLEGFTVDYAKQVLDYLGVQLVGEKEFFPGFDNCHIVYKPKENTALIDLPFFQTVAGFACFGR